MVALVAVRRGLCCDIFVEEVGAAVAEGSEGLRKLKKHCEVPAERLEDQEQVVAPLPSTRNYRFIDSTAQVQHTELTDLHLVQGEYARSFSLGGLDGATSAFSLLAGLPRGRHASPCAQLAVGLARLIAVSISMGLGDYLSSTEQDRWAPPRCEAAEHFTPSSRTPFISEAEAPATSSELDRWKLGMVCFLSFMACGLVPLLGFLVLFLIDGDWPSTCAGFLMTYALTAATLFAVGLVQARLSGRPDLIKAGMVAVLRGTLAGGTGCLVGDLLLLAF